MKVKLVNLLSLSTFAFMNLHGQIKLNEGGFNEVQLGKNIKDVAGIVPFSSSPGNVLFQIFPSDKDFYLWQLQDSTLFSNTKIHYVFLSSDTSGVIVKISLWLDDPDRSLATQLTRIYGEPKFKAETGARGLTKKDLTIWNLSPEISVFLAQPVEADPILHFPVTKLDFYQPHNLDKISRHIIGPKPIQ